MFRLESNPHSRAGVHSGNVKLNRYLTYTFAQYRKRSLQWLTFPMKPLPSQSILLHPRTNLLPNFLMIIINPFPLLLIQQLYINQPSIHRHHRNMFKSIIRTISKLIRRIYFLDNNHILNTNTKIAVLVKPRLCWLAWIRSRGAPLLRTIPGLRAASLYAILGPIPAGPSWTLRKLPTP